MRAKLSPELRALARRERHAHQRRNLKNLLVLAAALHILAAALTAPWWWEHGISLEKIGSYTASGSTMQPGWYAVDEGSWTTPDAFEARYAKETGGVLSEDFDLDFARYTYFVCHGGVLKRLTWRDMDRQGNGFVARGYVKPLANRETVNIYRAKKTIIDNDPKTESLETIVVY